MTCPIVELSVEPFERKEDSVLYPIKIKLYTNQVIELKYQYSEFVQLSKLLHQEYPHLRKQLSKLSRKKFYAFKSQQKHIERHSDIRQFCHQLLLLPSSVKSANLFLSFFFSKQAKTFKPTLSTSIKRTFSLKSNINKNDIVVVQQETQDRVILEEQIKFKVIYDKNNIIVVRVPRSITLGQLKSKLMQKFASLNIALPHHLAFRVIERYNHVTNQNNARYSIMSTSTISTTSTIDSSVYNHYLSSLDTLLVDEQDLSKAMKEKWLLHQKVVLQCII